MRRMSQPAQTAVLEPDDMELDEQLAIPVSTAEQFRTVTPSHLNPHPNEVPRLYNEQTGFERFNLVKLDYSNETYVIHAHGMVVNGTNIDLPEDISLFSPNRCPGSNLTYRIGHHDSNDMIKFSCPGLVADRPAGYILSSYKHMPEMLFEGERSPAHPQRLVTTPGDPYDHAKVNFTAGVYRCIGANDFNPVPEIRILPNQHYTLSSIMEFLIRLKPHTKINIVIATCLEPVSTDFYFSKNLTTPI